MEAAIETVQIGDLDVVLFLHTALDPEKEAWDIACAAVEAIKQRRHGKTESIRSLIITDGGSPNSAQRSQMLRGAFNGNANKQAVITHVLSNSLKRGVATAISWINPSFRALDPAHWEQALAHVDLAGKWPFLVDAFDRLQAQVTPVKSLQIVKKRALPETP